MSLKTFLDDLNEVYRKHEFTVPDNYFQMEKTLSHLMRQLQEGDQLTIVIRPEYVELKTESPSTLGKNILYESFDKNSLTKIRYQNGEFEKVQDVHQEADDYIRQLKVLCFRHATTLVHHQQLKP